MSDLNGAEEFDPLDLGLPDEVPEGLEVISGGGVTSARGFSAAGVHAGFRKEPGRLDLALVVAEEPTTCAAMFTRNVFCAAPVIVSRRHLEGPSYGTARALVVNSGCANAATGQRGLEDAQRSADIVADALGCTADEVMVASTGVIGVHLDPSVFESGVPIACEALSPEGGADAARAIMTTDTRPKEVAVRFSGDKIGWPGCTFTVGGMAKGAGMIMPDMATMISCITTDVPMAPDAAHEALVRAVGKSFNRITVDSDTSTNDSCYLFASGSARPSAELFERGTEAFALFAEALEYVCTALARGMAADGEGATKLVTVNVAGAATESDAELVARTIANSPLVKTAIFGKDANWGRIAAAAGRSGASFEQHQVAIDIMGIPVCREGLAVPFSEDEALRRFERPEIVLDVFLGAGTARATMWTCDFSHDYVTINGDYRT